MQGNSSLLLDFFLEEAAKELGKNKPSVPDELITLLGTYDFPGNIRELRSMVFNAVSKHPGGMMSLQVFRDTILQAGDDHRLEEIITQNVLFGDQLPTMKDIRKMLVHEAMQRAENNMTIAAGLIGISRQSLSQYIKTNNIEIA